MSSTSSRILRVDEHSAVTPVWWRDTSPAPVLQNREVIAPKEPPPPAQDQTRDQVREQTLARERERIEREAYQRGFAEGKGVGRDQAAAEVQPVLERLTKSLAELSSLRSGIRKDAEGDLLKLSISVARRVLHRELTLDPESIEGLIRIALEKLESRELCRVRVHPDQEPAIRASLERFANSRKVELIPDPSMQCGDVLFETAHGNIDASIEAQLREIERGFADRLGR
jgi:flagellar assembly protein FliH